MRAFRLGAIGAGTVALLVAGFLAGKSWERFAARREGAHGVSAHGVSAEGENAGAPRPAQLKEALKGLRDGAFGETADAVRLKPGQARRMTMNFRENPSQQFVVEVPANAVMMVATIEAAPCIFDVFGRALSPIDDPNSEADHYNAGLENKLRVSRYEEAPLETGDYYLLVEYPSIYPPVLGNRTLYQSPYEISVSFITTRTDGKLAPGKPQQAKLDPDTGSFRTFTVDVPASAKALRIDLDGTHSDLDVLARQGEQILHPEDADHTGAGRVGREILIIDEQSDPPLAPGRWYVNVVESMTVDDADFTIYASFDSNPPQPLLAIPSPPDTRDAKDRALFAAVDLTTGTYSGSGMLVSPTGLILTNHHVVTEAIVAAEALRSEQKKQPKPDGAAKTPALEDVIVGVTLDPRHPPVEMFRGEVVEYDEKEDLALVQVTHGYYGQPVPDGYRFPYVELGDPEQLAIGDLLLVVGFPAVGDLRNRPAVTLTQGIVSGFSDVNNIKTDAHISGGNSGGGAFDQTWRLVGCPTYTVSGYDGDYGQLGYVVSLRALPSKWRERIKPKE